MDNVLMIAFPARDTYQDLGLYRFSQTSHPRNLQCTLAHEDM